MEQQYDLIIIGGGSAAFAAAIRANDLQLNTLLVNGGLPLGGTCVNTGCVPSKFLIRAAESLHHANHSSFSGVQPKGAAVDFKQVIQQKKELIADMQRRKYLDLLEGLEHVKVIEGFASFENKNNITVNGKSYKGIKIAIATGSTTAIPPIQGLDDIPYLSNETLFDLEEQSESLIVVGGGYIGLEIAQLYSRFGTKVTIIEALDRVLATEAKDVTDELTKHLTSEGVEIITGSPVEKVWQEDKLIKVQISENGKDQTIEATHLVLATGRKPNTEKLNLDKAGVETDKKGHVVTNEYLETNVPNIYAIGDVNANP